ncbi:MAG TPA: ABC transporter ATP-binding protein [Candidatus Woesebacteria bacterium]|nr:ABC transporter ATP-binding protein [Candidatus Woesebacteria bacterium]HPR99814.1 ABC transporter ATP-binding protein [Candidatus Woesebacteria bacterium]
MKSLRTFYHYLGKYKWQMLLFLSVSTITVVLETVRPYWLKGILDNAQNNNFPVVFNYLILFGVSTVGANLISAFSYYVGDKVVIPFSREIRETIFQKVLELDFAYHVNKNTGSLISAFRRGDNAIFSIFDSIHHELFRVLITLIVTLYFLFNASPPIGFSLLILFVANIFLIWWLIKINLKYRKDFNDAEDNISGIITDSLINYETVKFFAAEEKERQRLSLSFDTWSQKFWGFTNSFRLMDISIGTTSGLGMLFILWLAIKKLNNGFTLGDLVMVSGFITGFYYQFFNLFFRIRDIAKSITDLDKYFGILDNTTQVPDPPSPQTLKNPQGSLLFTNLSFAYPGNNGRILDGINLEIKSGEQVAFVGRSGAGKTTLIKLLLRFYDPTSGVIKFDGVDITHFTKSYLRSLMAVVPQEPIMFNNTIKFNLSYGKEKAKMSEIKKAAADANILTFIENLPQKWQTEVGERGIKLSGGQKQRLAIARALLTNPKILIFDEATSNLDSESERQIQKALKIASQNRTVIIIAHRFSTIRNADKIVVLSNGIIAEIGKHRELIAKNGLYKMLWTLQSKGKLITDKESLFDSNIR